jgi:hypothetical protein
MALTACDWCGGYTECERCDDPATAKLMDELDAPMDADQGGHIHACCDLHELYWQDAPYWTEHEECEIDEGPLDLETAKYLSERGVSKELQHGRSDCECHQRCAALLEAFNPDSVYDKEKRQ